MCLDVFFDLARHIVIVEIDENQHNQYAEQCECARINEIVNSIGGKPVTIIRFNPDKVKNKRKIFPYTIAEKLAVLVTTIKQELDTIPDVFAVKLIQLYFNDDFHEYQPIKITDITSAVSV